MKEVAQLSLVDVSSASKKTEIVTAEKKISERAQPKKAKLKKLAPMLQQYVDMKRSNGEHLLLFQVGDFYEVFFQDAVTVAETLGIRLTSRNKEASDPIPMCGVPIHAIDNYLPKLVSAGFSCVLVSQVEAASASKGMVKREITRVVTPGVRYAEDGLDESKFNYLATAIVGLRGCAALSYADVSTGDLHIAQCESLDELVELIQRISPSELILPSTMAGVPVARNEGWLRQLNSIVKELDIHAVYRPMDEVKRAELQAVLTERIASEEIRQQAVVSCEQLSEEAGVALKSLLAYVEEVSYGSTPLFAKYQLEEKESRVAIDIASQRNLEIFETRLDGSRKHSLLDTIDFTRTAMGARLLSSWLMSPLCECGAIESRLGAVASLVESLESRERIQGTLSGVRDVDRLLSRVGSSRATPRDVRILSESIAELPCVYEVLSNFDSSLLVRLRDQLDTLDDVRDTLNVAISSEAPIKLSEGGIFNEGYHSEVDRLREINKNAKKYLLELEAREKGRTGITALKVKYNNVFGYFIEVSKANAAKVPDDYERKQTLVNAERYVTRELKEFEVEILSSRARQIELEKELFVALRSELAEKLGRIQGTSAVLAFLDVLCSLAQFAVEHNCCKPIFHDSIAQRIVEGRHPVVEKVIGFHNFVANDSELNAERESFAVLTGPNMGGKSTYLRQVGLIQLLAQIGSFVPATSAELGIVDRIFTRIGAADDLTRGDSTFMVEMREASTIVRKATKRSLVLIDEIGRGTATVDGLAIATAIAEWLIKNVACQTVFATHFHELTKLEDSYQEVKCLSVGVCEKNGEIEFTHRIEQKAAMRSYGIEVARLAGLPEGLLARASTLMQQISRESGQMEMEVSAPVVEIISDGERNALESLKHLEINNISPLDALVELSKIQKQIVE